MRLNANTWLVVVLVVVALASVSHAQPVLPPAPPGVEVTRTYGIEFSTVRAAGNAPHPAILPFPVGAMSEPFGSVNYEYRIGRTEVSTGQWLQFINTFSVQPNFPQVLFGQQSFVTIAGYPLEWGAVLDTTYSGPGRRFRLREEPGSADFPVTGISWRTAAMYCNWLHNGQSSDQASLFNGAYDTATFGVNANGFTDQLRHNPEARFWIPSFDEWTKAAFHDPDKNGPGQGGWWQTALRRDEPIVYGLPGIGEANAVGMSDPLDPREFRVPLGAYVNSQSAWGILDAAGAATEWTETAWDPVWADPVFMPTERMILGSYATSDLTSAREWDRLGSFRSITPSTGWTFVGFRVAAAVPSPSAAVSLAGAFVILSYRTRKDK